MPPSAEKSNFHAENFTSDLAFFGLGFPSPNNAKHNRGASPSATPGRTRHSGLLRSFIGKSPKGENHNSKNKQDDLEILAQKFNLMKLQQQLETGDASPKLPTRRQTISLGSPAREKKSKLKLNQIFTRTGGPISPKTRLNPEENKFKDTEKDKEKDKNAINKVKSFFGRAKGKGEKIDDLERLVRESTKGFNGSNGADKKMESGGILPKSSEEFPRSRSAIFYPFNLTEDPKESPFPQKMDMSKSMQLDHFGSNGRHISASRKAFRERFQVNKSALLETGQKCKTPDVSLGAELVKSSPRRQSSGNWSGKLAWIGFKGKSSNLTSSNGSNPGKPVSPEDEILAFRFAQSGDEAFALENYDVAVVEYSRAIDKKPLDAELVLCRATALYKMGCYVEALADAMRTIGLKPNWPKPHYQLGLIYKFLGDFKSAVQSFRTALELETDPPPSLVALTLKAETVLAMPTTDRSSTIKQDMPSPTVLSFQPSGSPLPRAKPDFFSGLHLAIPHGDGDVDSPLCSPSGGEEVSPFSFSSGDSLEVQELSQKFQESLPSLREGSLFLAVGKEDGTIALWDTASWQQVQSLNFHCDKVTHLSWSRSGTVLASASNDGLICLWELKDGKEGKDNEEWGNRTVSFTDLAGQGTNPEPGDGQQDTDESMRLKLMLDCQSADVSTLAFSESGDHVVAACGDNVVRVWSVATGGQLAVLEHPNTVTAVAFSLDDAILVTAGMDGQLRVWDLTKKIKICSFSARSIVSMQFCGTSSGFGAGTAKTQYLATCHQSSPSSLEGFVCLWQVSSFSGGGLKVEEISRICAQGRIFSSELRRTSEGGVVATLAQLDGSLNICNLDPSKPNEPQLRVLYPQKNNSCLTKLTLAPSGRSFAGLTMEKKVCLWSVADGKLQRIISE